MKTLGPIASAVLVIVAVIAAGWIAKSCRTWWELDACLDSAGAWDEATQTCRF